MGYDPLPITDEQYTTPSVVNELKFGTASQIRLKIALDTRRIRLREPSAKVIKEIEDSSIKVGDLLALSKVDREVLALSLELKQGGSSPILVSDDYAIQNVAEYLGLEFASLTNRGIRYRFKWLLYCPACRNRYPEKTSTKVCEICGTRLKRRVIRKTPTSKKTFIEKP